MNTGIARDHLSKGNLLAMMPSMIVGAEEEEQDDPQSDSKTDPDPSGEDDDPEEDDDPKDDKAGKNTAGLRSALQKERAAAKAAERELKKLKKEKEDRELAEKSELEQAQAKEKTATERAQKLAAGLLKRDIDDAIRRAAEKAGFTDTEDAVNGVDRSTIISEQDDDDPSDIKVDSASVKAAVKALATKKPHWIKQGTEDGEPSGGKFGGSKKAPTTETEEDRLRRLYPGQF